MRFYFNAMNETEVSNFQGGEGKIFIKKGVYDNNRVMQLRIPKGCTIGLHKHEGNTETIYVIAGTGIAVCDGEEYKLSQGVCHVCKKGSEHTIISSGEEDLLLFSSITV